MDERKSTKKEESLYAILELPKSASADDIEKSYQRLSHQFHPLLDKGDPDSAEKFKEINRAHAILSDESKRNIYDSYGSMGFYFFERLGWFNESSEIKQKCPNFLPSKWTTCCGIFCGTITCCYCGCCCCCFCCNFCCGRCKPTCGGYSSDDEAVTTQPTSERTESEISETSSLLSPPESCQPKRTESVDKELPAAAGAIVDSMSPEASVTPVVERKESLKDSTTSNNQREQNESRTDEI